MRFAIGDRVKVSAKMVRFMNHAKKEVSWGPYAYKKSMYGRVVGMAHRCSGTHHKGECHTHTEDFVPGYLSVSEVHSFWLVRFGWYNKPVLVQDKDLILCEDCFLSKFPMLYTEQCAWSEGARACLRKEMMLVPRDSKGRWIKEKRGRENEH